MSRKSELIVTVIGGLTTAFAMGYAWAMRKKNKAVEEELSEKVTEMLDDGTLDIRQTIINDAVQDSVERRVGCYLDTSIKRTCDKTAERCIDKVNDAISARAREAVDEEFQKAADKARIEINKQICDIDVSGLKRDIHEAAQEQMLRKLDGSMDDILEKFNGNLNNVKTIYEAIAKNFERRS